MLGERMIYCDCCGIHVCYSVQSNATQRNATQSVSLSVKSPASESTSTAKFYCISCWDKIVFLYGILIGDFNEYRKAMENEKNGRASRYFTWGNFRYASDYFLNKYENNLQQDTGSVVDL